MCQHGKIPSGKKCLQCEYARRKVRRAEKRNVLWEYFKNNPCTDCKESDPIVLEFDHRDPADKSFEIGVAMAGGVSLKKILEEIEKCDVVCANCHKRRTAAQFNYYAPV